MSRDFRPQPIYPSMLAAADAPLAPFQAGEWISCEFEAPEDDLEALHWHRMLWSDRHRLHVRVENATQNRVLHDEVIAAPENSVTFAGDNAEGDKIRVSLRWDKERPPVCYTGGLQPAPNLTARMGEREIVPFFQVSTERDAPLNFEPKTWHGEEEFRPGEPCVIEFDAPDGRFARDLPADAAR